MMYFSPPPHSPADEYDGEGDIIQRGCWARCSSGEWNTQGCSKKAISALGLCADHYEQFIAPEDRP